MSSWSNIERYRATAAQLRQLTRQMHHPESRIETIKLAEQFERLADHVERRLELASQGVELLPFRRGF
jgi:hypothetical protein